MSVEIEYRPFTGFSAACKTFDDSIKEKLQVDDHEIAEARDQFSKTVSFWETFRNRHNDSKGAALEIAEYASFFLTAGGFGFWAWGKLEQVWWINHAGKTLLNPTIFTRKVSDFHKLGVSPQDAAKGIVPRKVAESHKYSPIDLKKIEREIKVYRDRTIPDICRLINVLFMRLPIRERTDSKRRAFFAAFVHQATITRTKSEIHQESLIDGLSNNIVQGLGSEKDWAIEAILGILKKKKFKSCKERPYLEHSERAPLLPLKSK